MVLPRNGFAQPVEVVVGGPLPRNGFVQPVEVVGGSVPSPSTPVAGGSGTFYASITAALAGESQTVVSGLVPQAGTGPGVIVGPNTLSAVDNFYKDMFVVDTSVSPGNGMAAQWARVSSYVGATRTLTLDKPWDFSAEATFEIVDPVRLTVFLDITEDVTVNKNLVIDFCGNRLKGKLDITAADLCWIRGGGGFITNGVQKGDFGLLRIDECEVSRRDATIYAVLLTEGSNIGRCELSWCRFDGRVAARRGLQGWRVYYCQNVGVPSNSNTQNLPYALVESPSGGAAVVVSALDISVTGEIGGALIYSENSVTGPAAWMSIQCSISQPNATCNVNPFPLSFARAQGSGTLTLTVTGGQITITSSGAVPVPIQGHAALHMVSALNLTGTINVNFGSTGIEVYGLSQHCTGLGVEGSSDMTGSITVSGNVTMRCEEQNDLFFINIESRLNGGSISWAASINIYGGTLSVIRIAAAQNAGAPTVTISGQIIIQGTQFQGEFFDIEANVSVGTWTISGNIFFQGQGNQLMQVPSGWSAGTINVSSSTIYLTFWDAGISPGFLLLSWAATGGSATISGSTFIDGVHFNGVCRIIQGTGTGGTATYSGPVNIYNGSFEGEMNVVIGTGNGVTCVVSGALAFFSCRFESDCNFVRTTNAGSSVTGPPSLVMEHCTILGSPQTVVGPGTNTWANATLRFRHCHIEGLFTGSLTPFTTVEAYHSRFNGNSANNSVSVSGTLPTTYRYWKCSFAADVSGLTPEIIDDYVTLPAAAALSRGQPVTVNASGQAAACVAASIVEGVSLDAPAGAGSRTVVVRRGKAFVTCKAGVAAGDNLALDLATNTQMATSPFTPGQNGGWALEAVGTTIAGKSYSLVNVR